MTARNFEGRRFEDKHQAQPLAEWLGDATWADDVITPANLAPDSPRHIAVYGHWLIKGPGGTVRIERGGNQEGYCTDCGEPVWWHDERLVTREGVRWCYGLNDAHPGMTHWHVLPGMAQYVARSADGETCHCLDAEGPHIHRTFPADPLAKPEDAWDAALRDATGAAIKVLAALPYQPEPPDRIVYVSALTSLVAELMGLAGIPKWHERLFAAINGECGQPGQLFPATGGDAEALADGPAAPRFWRASMVVACPAHADPGAQPVERFAQQRKPCQHRDPDPG